MAAPCVLITSCSNNFNTSDLVEQLLCLDTMPSSTALMETIVSYPWHINTKYYTADVRICSTDTRTIGNQQFADSVEAFVVYFSSNEISSFEQVKSWLPFLTEMNPDVLLLVCNRCAADDVVSRKTVDEWCIEHSFELVEMSPDVEDVDEEDDFADSYGITRIRQALHAHSWPNLMMKDKPDIRSPYFQKLMQEEAEASVNSTNSYNTNTIASETDSSDTNNLHDDNPTCQNAESKETEASGWIPQDKTSTQEKPGLDSLLDEDKLELFEALGSDDPESGAFEALFSNLRLMKEKAEVLPAEERKVYAEKVAVSFWRAMGGGDEEIEDISDSSHD